MKPQTYCPISGETRCRCLKEQEPITALRVDLNKTLRKLFTDHGVYTALVLKSIVDHNKADTEVLIPRLLENQQDIGDNLKPLIGKKNGETIAEVLTKHVKLAGDVIKGAVNKSKKLDEKIKALFTNSDDVAFFLYMINPDKLDELEMQEMFHHHNEMVIEMAQARIAKNYKEEQILFDAYYNELLEMSDQIFYALK